jgi:hypothetical protein
MGAVVEVGFESMVDDTGGAVDVAEVANERVPRLDVNAA